MERAAKIPMLCYQLWKFKKGPCSFVSIQFNYQPLYVKGRD